MGIEVAVLKRRPVDDDAAAEEAGGEDEQVQGVQLHQKSGQWRATIWRKELRRSMHLGYFEEETDAAKAYDEAARTVYGEDAWVNFE